MNVAEAVAHLRSRGDSYARDAVVLAADGDNVSAVMYRTIADELRKIADELAGVRR